MSDCLIRPNPTTYIRVEGLKIFPSCDRPAPYARPEGTQMNNDEITKIFTLEIASWEESLRDCIAICKEG